MIVCPKCYATNREVETTCIYCGEELKKKHWRENALPRILRAIGKGAFPVVTWTIVLVFNWVSDGDSLGSGKTYRTKTPGDQPGESERLTVHGSGFQTLVSDADVHIIATGRNLTECFANAARGMYKVVSDVENTQPLQPRQVSITAPDLETLLVNWLNELLYLFQVEGILFTEFTIHTLSDQQLEATCTGNRVDLQRQPVKIVVNPASAHSAQVYQGNGIDVEVILEGHNRGLLHCDIVVPSPSR